MDLRALGGAAIAAALLTAAPARAEPPVTDFTLDNGMRAVVIEDHRAPVVIHMVWYPVGAADEPWGKSGIAHFLEHLMFKATDEMESGEFSKVVAANGGSDNAFTSYDYTAYHQRIAADRLGLVMEMEADRMRDLAMTDEEVARERAVILEERNQRTDNSPQALFSEQMDAALYKNHPYGIPVIGWRHEMEALSRDDALAFYRRHYAPDNAILIVAGDVQPDEVRRLAEQHYGPLEPSGNPPDARPQEPPQLAPRRVSMQDPRVRQPYVVRKYLATSRGEGNAKQAAALDILAEILGSGITSRFSERLVRGDRIAVDAGAWYSATRRDAGEFTIYGVPATSVALDEIEAALDEVLAEMREAGPTGAELERVKTKARAARIYARDNLSSEARKYGMALAVGLGLEDIAAWPGILDAVTVDDVREAARSLTIERSVTGHLTGTPTEGQG